MADRPPVVMEAPAAEPPAAPPAEEQPAPQQETQQEPEPTPKPVNSRQKVKITKEGRRWLRAACAAAMIGSDRGNRIADWLDKQPEVEVHFIGRFPEPQGVLTEGVDEPPVVDRRDPEPNPMT